MYQVNEKEDIYLYDFSHNQYIRHWDNMEELLNYLAAITEKKDWYPKNNPYSNTYLENINVTGNDIKEYGAFQGTTFISEYCLRPYLFVDANNRYLDIRLYMDEIQKRMKTVWENKKRYDGEIERGDKLYLWKGEHSFRYRIDPVPFIHNYSHGSYYRHPKTFQEMKNNTGKEYGEYVRAKRKHLPTVYDDIVRGDISDKCWKRKKIKHQWQKHTSK